MESLRAAEMMVSRCDFMNPDEFLYVHTELKTQLKKCSEVDADDDFLNEFARIMSLSAGFEYMHKHLIALMRGAIDPDGVLAELARFITPPGDNHAPVTNPFGTTVYISDWNGFLSMFDAEVKYTDVNPIVRDILLALTNSRTVPCGTTLELRFDFCTGRFICPSANVEVFNSDRPWFMWIDATRMYSLKYESCTAGAALWTLLHEQGATFVFGPVLVLNAEVGDALRWRYNVSNAVVC